LFIRLLISGILIKLSFMNYFGKTVSHNLSIEMYPNINNIVLVHCITVIQLK